MKKHIRNEKGITGIDIVVSIIIFIIGAIAIFNIYTKIYESSTAYKANEIIIGYLTEICEEIDYENYDDITLERVNKIVKSADIPEQYNITYTIENYKDIKAEEGITVNDNVKKVVFNVKYDVGKQSRNFMFPKIKVRE